MRKYQTFQRNSNQSTSIPRPKIAKLRWTLLTVERNWFIHNILYICSIFMKMRQRSSVLGTRKVLQNNLAYFKFLTKWNFRVTTSKVKLLWFITSHFTLSFVWFYFNCYHIYCFVIALIFIQDLKLALAEDPRLSRFSSTRRIFADSYPFLTKVKFCMLNQYR